MKHKPLRSYAPDEVTDKHIGRQGTPTHVAFEGELRLDLIGKAIRQVRKERHLTQEELGLLVGVKKAQISKLENSLTNARFGTIIRVFNVLNAKICFNVELINQTVKII
jgi:HTH-type transcriptional regulator / antitoxin HipB